MRTFDVQLRKILAERNIQHKVICQDLGFNQGTFSRWTNGEREPKIDAVQKIAEYLNLSMDYFFKNGDVPITNESKTENKERRKDHKKPCVDTIIELANKLSHTQRHKLIRIAREIFDIKDIKIDCDGGNNDPIFKKSNG